MKNVHLWINQLENLKVKIIMSTSIMTSFISDGTDIKVVKSFKHLNIRVGGTGMHGCETWTMLAKNSRSVETFEVWY